MRLRLWPGMRPRAHHSARKYVCQTPVHDLNHDLEDSFINGRYLSLSTHALESKTAPLAYPLECLCRKSSHNRSHTLVIPVYISSQLHFKLNPSSIYLVLFVFTYESLENLLAKVHLSHPTLLELGPNRPPHQLQSPILGTLIFQLLALALYNRCTASICLIKSYGIISRQVVIIYCVNTIVFFSGLERWSFFHKCLCFTSTNAFQTVLHREFWATFLIAAGLPVPKRPPYVFKSEYPLVYCLHWRWPTFGVDFIFGFTSRITLLESFRIAMPHITAQCLLADTTQIGYDRAAGKAKSERNRKNEKLNSPGIHLDLRGLSAKSLRAIPDARSSSNRGSHIQKMSALPTPTSAISAVFDSPQKSSPLSSVSSTNPLAIVQRANTPIAELEDTSLAHLCSELEDTSNQAVRSRGGKSLSSYTVKSMHPTVSHFSNLFSGKYNPG